MALEDCSFVPSDLGPGEARLGSDREPVRFTRILSGLPKLEPPEPTRHNPDAVLEPPHRREPAILQQYPELAEAHKRWVAKHKRKPASRHRRAEERLPRIPEEEQEEPSEDIDIDRVCAETRELRFAAQQTAEDSKHFWVKHPGGVWSELRHGRPLVAAQGLARSEEARRFCEHFKFRASSYFDINLYGGVDDATELSNYWASRMRHFTELFIRTNERYTQEFVTECENYQETAEIEALYAHGNADVRSRIDRIRCIGRPPGTASSSEGP
jgi:hypothetical protein